MRHKFLVLTVKKLLKSVYIYGSYRKIKTGLSLFWTTRYIVHEKNNQSMLGVYPVEFNQLISQLSFFYSGLSSKDYDYTRSTREA